MLDEQLPYYLSIGMTPDEYWHGDNNLPIAYRKAFELKRKRKNWELYYGGLYNMLGVASLLSSESKYPDMPLPMNEKEKEEQDEIRIKNKYYEMLRKMRMDTDKNVGES